MRVCTCVREPFARTGSLQETERQSQETVTEQNTQTQTQTQTHTHTHTPDTDSDTHTRTHARTHPHRAVFLPYVEALPDRFWRRALLDLGRHLAAQELHQLKC